MTQQLGMVGLRPGSASCSPTIPHQVCERDQRQLISIERRVHATPHDGDRPQKRGFREDVSREQLPICR